ETSDQLLRGRDGVLRLDAKQYQVVGSELAWIGRSLDREVKISRHALHLEAAAPERTQMLAARAEVDLVAGSLQPCAVECADRARAHHQDLHSILIEKAPMVPLVWPAWTSKLKRAGARPPLISRSNC